MQARQAKLPTPAFAVPAGQLHGNHERMSNNEVYVKHRGLHGTSSRKDQAHTMHQRRGNSLTKSDRPLTHNTGTGLPAGSGCIPGPAVHVVAALPTTEDPGHLRKCNCSSQLKLLRSACWQFAHACKSFRKYMQSCYQLYVGSAHVRQDVAPVSGWNRWPLQNVQRKIPGPDLADPAAQVKPISRQWDVLRSSCVNRKHEAMIISPAPRLQNWCNSPLQGCGTAFRPGS